ncbi:MAG: FecR domain-containing protein [Marinifilaceae bacterium]|jgi:hypothetical protein|nr:FecR domain-containing protein [Marinifilaceae bacterium]
MKENINKYILDRILKVFGDETIKSSSEILNEDRDIHNWADGISEHKYLHNKINAYRDFDINKDWEILSEKTVLKRKRLVWVKYAASVIVVLSLSCFAYLISSRLIPSNENLVSKYKNESIKLEIEGQGVYNIEDTTNANKIDNDKINISKRSISYIGHRTDTIVKWNKLITPRAKKYKVELADGSIVWLNSRTKLRFPDKFTGNKRIVYLLEGEAYFEIQKDINREFIVWTDSIQVKVLGTKFNIRAYSNFKEKKITLKEGSVELSKSDKKQILVPNMQAVVSENNITSIKVNANDICSWVNSMLIYKTVRLDDIFQDLTKYYDFDLEYENNELKNKYFSIAVKNRDSISDILKAIELTGKVQFTIQKNKIIVKTKK